MSESYHRRNPVKQLVAEQAANFFITGVDVDRDSADNFCQFSELLSAKKPGVMVFNHLSNADAPVVRRTLKILGYKDIADNLANILGVKLEKEWLERQLIGSFSYIRAWPLSLEPQNHKERSEMRTTNIASMRTAKQHLEAGNPLGLFPEGTRGRDKKLNPVDTKNTSYWYLITDTYVSPWAVWGSENVWPIGKKIPRRAGVHVRIGRPISIEAEQRQFGHLPKDRMRAAITDKIMGVIASMLPEDYRGYYGGKNGKSEFRL